MQLHAESLSSPADAANVGAPVENVDLEQAIFEKTSNIHIHDYTQNALMPWRTDQVALGPGSEVYKPTMGGYYSSGSTPTTAVNAGTSPPSSSGSPSAPVHHGTPHQSHAIEHAKQPAHFKTHDISPDHKDVAAQTTDAPAGEYSVQSGDNLWEIARKHLGDGSRWGEIYKMNADAIGQNPDLIHPGTSLKLPEGGTTVAGGKYLVQPGDNLWDISRHHLGGGQHWGNLYHMNESVIGGNPRLILPGQELNLGANGHIAATVPGAHHHHIASAAGATHSPHIAHATQHPQHIAHAAEHPQHIAHDQSAVQHGKQIAMEPGSANIAHHATEAQSATMSAQGQFKLETPVYAPVNTSAATGAAGSSAAPAAPSATSQAPNEQG
jgi:Tfp pilus assembly protein FimV